MENRKKLLPEPEASVMAALRKGRKNAGITQKQLAAKTGVAQADISRIENGNANPSLHTLRRLAAGMGMQVKVIFQSPEGNTATLPAQERE